uniref:Uncharacterized protein n=1 Tax=Arundo donax TaxID=35708 RepID=A0A0A9E8M8_ARUDO
MNGVLMKTFMMLVTRRCQPLCHFASSGVLLVA